MQVLTEYRILDIVLGLITTALVAALVINETPLFDPVPYRGAQVIEAERTQDNHLHVAIAYRKTSADCEYQRGQAFALLPGAREPVSFEAMRGPGQTSQRFEGQQMLRWDIDLNGWYPDVVEIWTRHDCEGHRIDRLMATVEVPE